MAIADMILMGAFLLVLAGIGWNMGPGVWDSIKPKKAPPTRWPRN